MPAELHLSPDCLHAHAVVAAELADRLRAAGPAASDSRPEAERLAATLRRVTGELDELCAALAGVARAVAETDREATGALRRLPA